MDPFTILIILAVTSSAVAFLMPKPNVPPVKPQDLQTPPTTKQGTPIRIAAGRQHQENSNLVDYGNVQSYAIRAKGGKK